MSSLDLFSLKGRTAVVIGGTGELCGAMAEGFASAGAHVILVGRDPAKADARLAKIKAAGGSGEFLSTRPISLSSATASSPSTARSTSSSTAPASTPLRPSSRSMKPSSTAS